MPASPSACVWRSACGSADLAPLLQRRWGDERRAGRHGGTPAAPRAAGPVAGAGGVDGKGGGSPLAAAAAFVATGEAGTRRLAAALAAELRDGDVYLLHGAVGAGKSTFSRAFVRAAAGDPCLPVPSPTFLLQQIYEDHEGPPIHHFDLYRLGPTSDLGRLDLAASFTRAVCLVEWPERLPAAAVPAERLELRIEIVAKDVQLRLEEAWQQEQGQEGAAASGGREGPSGMGSDGTSSSTGGGTEARSAGKGESGASIDEDEGEEEEDDTYTDKRWRRVQMAAHGERWPARLARLQALVFDGMLQRVRLLAEPAAAPQLCAPATGPLR